MGIDRPNFSIYNPNQTYTFLGDNNLKKEFIDCFSIILSSCYEDDTRSARFFNKTNEDGTSAYYIHQAIERDLEEFVNIPGDSEKFLIGFTGIGKTTLIKNFFKLNGEPPFYTDKGDLVSYLSVYSEIINSEQMLYQVFVAHLRDIAQELHRRSGFFFQENGEFIVDNIEAFYQFAITYHKKLLKEESELEEIVTDRREILLRFEKKYAIYYYTTLIAYLLTRINNSDCRPISKIILIYDDIEAQDPELHIPFIDITQKISAQLRSFSSPRNFSVKSLISLRNYTFRYNFARRADAMRSYAEDVILKEHIPDMRDIFKKRFNVYYENEDVKKFVSEERWSASVKVLNDVIDGLSVYGETISGLANHDISHSLKMLMRILTNHRWFAPNEGYYNGAYSLKPQNYEPIKERTIRALIYGESDVFVDSVDNVLPNILCYHTEEKEGIELLSLYIMEYMLFLQRMGRVTLYGKSKIKGRDLCQNIVNALNCTEKEDSIDYVIEQLYKQRCLLQSIFEAEQYTAPNRNSERRYNNSLGLYLSIRGNKIMEMLKNDSLLLEIYRDDIDTDIAGNTTASSVMSQKDKMIYLAKYCEQLFEIEKDYIMRANKSKYFSYFGGEFVVSRLVRGLRNSYFYYYKTPDDSAAEVRAALKKIIDNMMLYGQSLVASDPSLPIKWMTMS